MTDIEVIDKAALRRVVNALLMFRMVDPYMPMGAAKAFLVIAEGGVESIADLQRKVGCGQATASRYVHYLSDCTRFKEPGKGLVALRVDPDDGRRKLMEPTAAGWLLVGMLKNALAGGSGTTAGHR